MKTRIQRLTILVLAVLFTLGSFSVSAKTFSEVKKETRNVENFNQVALSLPGNLYLTQGSKNEVIIEADEDVLAKIETEVNGTTLNIGFEKWYNYRGTGKINVYITVKEINKLILAGSGDIIAKSAINTERIGFVISGSGTIIVDDLKANQVKAVISGSGDIKIDGKNNSSELDATVTGSGDFDSNSIEYKNADLTITGSGTIRAIVIDELDANITGSGRIYYKGKPLIDADITGSGKIKNEN